MTDIIPEGVTRLLLVEGQDDRVFFERLLAYMNEGRAQPLDVAHLKTNEYRGKQQLWAAVGEYLRLPNFDNVARIGIVCDADFNETDTEREAGAPRRALDSVNSQIHRAYSNYDKDITPPLLEGFMTPTSGKPSFSLLVLPGSDKETEGSLETMLLDALGKDPLLPCVDDYFRCVQAVHPQSDIARNRLDKNRLDVMLAGKLILRDMARSKDATRELPRHMYSMKWWSDELLDHPAFADARNFLRQLLSAQPRS